MRIRIEPTVLIMIGSLLLGSIGLILGLVDYRGNLIVRELANRNFQSVARAAVQHLNMVVAEPNNVLRELRTKAEQSELPLYDHVILGRLLAERLRETQVLRWISYGEEEGDRFVGARRTDSASVVVNWSDPKINDALPRESLALSDGRWTPLPPPVSKPYRVRQQTWFQHGLLTDARLITGPYPFFEGIVGFTISTRVTNAEQAPIGVFTADFYSDDIANGLAKLVTSEEDIIVFNFNGDALLSAGGKRIAGLRSAAELAMRDHQATILGLDQDQQVSFDTSFQDRLYRVTFQRVSEESGFRWLLAVAIPYDVLFGEAAKLQRDLLIGGGVVLLVGLGFGYIFARALTKPIRGLDTEAQLIAAFDLDSTRRLPKSRILEIADLSRTMITMRSGIHAFGRFVPQVLVRDLIASGIEPDVGGERRELTVMFSDVAGFTAISEHTDPEILMARMSDYLTTLSTEVHRHGGTVDKFIGDAVMALWNAPEADPLHPIKAARAVLACHKAGLALGTAFAEQGFPALTTRFGLHLGEAVVGHLGGGDRLQYTAIGGMVNLASRVEGLNKYYGTEILMTEAVQARLDGSFLHRLAGRAMPVGVTRPIGLYELMGTTDGEDAARLQAQICRWNEARDAFDTGRFAEAVVLLRRLLSDYPADTLAARTLTLAEKFQADPPADWDGVDRFTSK